jgi:hypothetical protein
MIDTKEMNTMHTLQSLLMQVRDSAQFDVDVRSYSGRGMYGENCLGVTISPGEMGQFIARLMEAQHLLDTEEGDEEVKETEWEAVAKGLRRWTQDSMGRGTIIYFPGVPFVDYDDEV